MTDIEEVIEFEQENMPERFDTPPPEEIERLKIQLRKERIKEDQEREDINRVMTIREPVVYRVRGLVSKSGRSL